MCVCVDVGWFVGSLVRWFVCLFVCLVGWLFVCLFVWLFVCLFVCVEIHFSSAFSMDDDCHFGGSRLKPTLSAHRKQDFGERG